MAEHAKPWTFGDFLRRCAVGMCEQLRDRLPGETWRGRLRFLAGVAMVVGCLLVPYSYPRAEIYLTGEQVTAHVIRCALATGGYGPSRGYWCDGAWALRDGTAGSGRIDGITGSSPTPMGTAVAVRATPHAAVTDNAGCLVALGLGLICLLGTAILVIRLFFHLIRATRPSGE